MSVKTTNTTMFFLVTTTINIVLTLAVISIVSKLITLFLEILFFRHSNDLMDFMVWMNILFMSPLSIYINRNRKVLSAVFFRIIVIQFCFIIGYYVYLLSFVEPEILSEYLDYFLSGYYFLDIYVMIPALAILSYLFSLNIIFFRKRYSISL